MLLVNRVIKFIALLALAYVMTFALGYEVKVDSLIMLMITVAFLKTSHFGKRAFLVWIALTTLYIPVAWNYGAPNLTIISSLIETNPSEAMEFTQDLELVTVFAAVGFFLLSCILFRIVPAIPLQKSSLLYLAAFTFLIFDKPVRTIIERDINQNYSHAMLDHMRYTPIRFAFDWYDAYDKYYRYHQQLAEQQKIAPTWKVLSHRDSPTNTILVIGESVRKDYMHAYGFSMENTQFMSHANGQLWTNFISPGPNTLTSVMRYITLNHGLGIEAHNNINTLAEAAGIETFWISNQGRIGEFDTSISSVAGYANSVFFTRTGSYADSKIYDSELLPSIKSALSSSNKAKLIVVHLMGSHSAFCDRVEEEPSFQFNGDKISCYVESIEQTDAFIEKINQFAQAQALPYNLVYVADHGLAHRNGGRNLRHDPSKKQSYQVPLFITGTAFTSREVIDYPRNGFTLLRAMSELMGISTEQFKQSPSFLSPYKDEATVNNGEGQLVPFSSLKDDPIVS